MKNNNQRPPLYFYHVFKLYYLQRLIWSGEKLEEAPMPELPLGIAALRFNTKKVEDYYRLFGSEDGVTWRQLPLDLIAKAKKRKGY